jgi:xanthine dehydrogenase YagR molybdenum-binding subunit
VEKGADLDLGDSSGMTPLYAAVDMNTLAFMHGRPTSRPSGRLSSVDLVKLLLARGAKPDVALTAPDGATEKLEDTFRRLGVSAIEEYAEYAPEGVKPDAVKSLYAGKGAMTGGPKGRKLMYAMGAEFVEVRVNAATREIRVPRIVGAFAGGRIMNTRTARSQYMGGMIWGISSALHEATEIDHKRARYVNDNLADYLVPVNADIQQMEVILVPEQDDAVNCWVCHSRVLGCAVKAVGSKQTRGG